MRVIRMLPPSAPRQPHFLSDRPQKSQKVIVVIHVASVRPENSYVECFSKIVPRISRLGVCHYASRSASSLCVNLSLFLHRPTALNHPRIYPHSKCSGQQSPARVFDGWIKLRDPFLVDGIDSILHSPFLLFQIQLRLKLPNPRRQGDVLRLPLPIKIKAYPRLIHLGGVNPLLRLDRLARREVQVMCLVDRQ